MTIIKEIKEENSDKTPGAAPVLKTEWPLSEKDEQAEAIERTKELQNGAKKKWEQKKIKNS